MQNVLSLAGTRVAAGALLQRWTDSIIARLVWAALVLGLCAATATLPYAVLSGFAAFSLLVLWGVLELFLHDWFVTDVPVAETDDDREALSHDLVFRLAHFPDCDVRSLIVAAVTSPRGAFFLREIGLEAEVVRTTLIAECDATSPDVAAFIRTARTSLPQLQRNRISPSVVLATAFVMGMGADLVRSANVSTADITQIVRAGTLAQTIAQRDRIFSLPWMLRHVGGIGRGWSQGYTDALDVLTEDLSLDLDRSAAPVVQLHVKEAQSAIAALDAQDKHNVILVGEAGTGRRTLVRHIARTIRDVQRKSGNAESRIVLLRTEQLLSGVRSPDQFLLSALRAAKHAGTFILVCHDLPALFASASTALKPVLLRLLQEPSVHLLGVADPVSYHRLRDSDPAVPALLQEVAVNEPRHEEIAQVLMEHGIELSRGTGVTVTYRAVTAVLSYAERFVADVRLPGKAVQILHDAVTLAVKLREPVIREEHIRDVVSSVTQIDVRRVEGKQQTELQTLEARLNAKIIGQSEAVRAITSSLKRSRLDVGERKKPVGTFLLLGPTGVGKTYTALVLAEEYAGTKENFLRIDLNEYATEESGALLFSAAEKSPLLRHIHDHPSSIILLDEIEKAPKGVLHLFLQLLDEGRVSDKEGRTYDFRNALILATSNAGADFVRTAVANGVDRSTFGRALLAHLLDAGTFTPEFVNRFDDVIAFMPLTAADAQAVLRLHLAQITEKLAQQRGITLVVDNACIAAILERGVSSEFGARELRRMLADTVETVVADRLLQREWSRGETMEIGPQDLRF